MFGLFARKLRLHLGLKGRTIRLQGGEQEVFVKKKKLDPLKGKKKKKTWPTHRRKKKNLTHMRRKKKKLVLLGWKKNLPTHRRRGKKYTPGTSVIPRGRGRPLSKGGYLFDLWKWHSYPKCSLQVDVLNFKHCMEPGGGALPKNMWRVCAATLTPYFKLPVTEWPPFYFSHFALT